MGATPDNVTRSLLPLRNADVLLADERPRLDGAGTAAAGIAASLGGQAVDLDVDGKVTSLNGTMLRWSDRGQLVEAQPPVPAPVETYGHDGYLRRISRTAGSVEEFYVYEGPNRVGIVHEGAGGAVAVDETVLFAGVDDALRLKRGGSTVAYFETDLAGNVRRLRAPGGGDLGGYRYSAFGKTVEDTATVTQSLRWKGRWYSQVAGGLYDVRARQWSPQLGAFLTIDEFAFHDAKTTLWGWPAQNPVSRMDPSGRFDPAGFIVGVGASTAGAALGGAALVLGGLTGTVGAVALSSSLNGFSSPEPGSPGSGGGPAASVVAPAAAGRSMPSADSAGGPGVSPYRTPGDPGPPPSPLYPQCAGLTLAETAKCCRDATGHREEECDENDPKKKAYDDCMDANYQF
jgi:RHS repeat-associated protein